MGSLRTLHKRDNEPLISRAFCFPWYQIVYPGDPVTRYKRRMLSYGILHTWAQANIPMTFRVIDLSKDEGVTVCVFDYIDRDDGTFSWYWSLSLTPFETRKRLEDFDTAVFNDIQTRGFYGIQDVDPSFPNGWTHTYDIDYPIPEIGKKTNG
jgi:hypothetical protein